MIKVLHLISGGDVGGAKTHVLSLTKELQKHIKVKIICFIEGEFYEDAKAMGIDIEVLEQKKRYDLSVINDLRKIIEDEGYDLVHSHGARANFICRFLKGKLRIPFVTTIHSDFMLDFKGNLYKHLIYTNLNVFALKKFDYYIAVSDDFKNMLMGRGFPEKKIFTVYNGLDFEERVSCMDRSDFLNKVGLSHLNDSLLVGILARLHPVKGHTVLIKAAANVLKVHKNVDFLLAGDGEEKGNLMNLANTLGISHKIHFIGFVNNYDILNCIDINVLTSYSESFPYVLLEGAKLKKPTIASEVGGIPMLIKNEENGLLFQSGDSEELSRDLIKLVESSSLRKVLGEKLFEHSCNKYSLVNLAKKHLEIYTNVISRSKN